MEAAKIKHGTSLRRFTTHTPALTVVKTLAADHPSIIEGRTIYLKRVIDPRDSQRLFKSGAHNRKIGGQIQKGKWAGMPVYTLTLEERATCPRSCVHWFDCFGNKMNWSERLTKGPELEGLLNNELKALQKKHPRGFVVRLHVLGDFYSVAYVALWMTWLARFPALHCFGYTAWPSNTAIGRALIAAARDNWDRFAIRQSNGKGAERSTITLYHKPSGPTVGDAIVCPAQTDQTDCCSTCGLCWGTQRNIAFLAH